MGFSRWLCTNTTKNMLVKIVHPGGHTELHDRPILASEVMFRNPRCCVTYPHVFQQPWAIVEPNATLMLGEKFYVVPICTIRKLQRLYQKQSPPSTSSSSSSPSQDIGSGQGNREEKEDDRQMVSACWLFKGQNSTTSKISYSKSLKSDDENRSDSSSTITTTRELMEKEDQGFCWDDESCFMCLLTGVANNKEASSDDRGGSTTSSSSSSTSSAESSSEKKELVLNINVKRRKNRKGIKTSLKRCSSFDNWTPSLESISEE